MNDLDETQQELNKAVLERMNVIQGFMIARYNEQQETNTKIVDRLKTIIETLEIHTNLIGRLEKQIAELEDNSPY